MQIVAVLSGIVGVILAVYFNKRERRSYKRIDRMLDEILEEQPLSQSDIQEGSISVLAGKMIRIQEKLNIEIEQAKDEREQVKGLISNMSHQLKTPLANVLMYQELLDNEKLAPEKKREFLQTMRVNLNKIDWLLNSLFKMVRLEQNVISFEAENLPVKPTLALAVGCVYEKAEKKQIQIVTEEFEETIIWHNRKWTCEALVNILENAVKYSEAGKIILISLKKYEMYSAIEIKDHGRGIKKSEQAKIFGRFYRSSDVENIEGSGIGLYLTRLILEKEKGYITVESQYQKGTKFTVFLQNCKN